jgi:hypothetical protein
MGYLGTKPANSPLTSELIPDGIITTSDLASGLTVNFADGSASTPSITNDGDTNTGIFFPAADTIAFAEGGSESMRIDSSGRAMINTTSSDYNFRVNGVTHFGDAYDAGTYGVVQISRPAAQGSAFHLAFVRSGSMIAGIGFLNNSNTFAIQVASNNAGSGVTLAPSATSWGTTSDERKKDILGNVENALQKLADWRTVYYKYKTDDEDGLQRVGLIAQDVQATLPEAISVEDDEINSLQLRYTETIPLLVKAIQEQQAIITELKTRIEALEQA